MLEITIKLLQAARHGRLKVREGKLKGRGAGVNPPNRFERLHLENFDDSPDQDSPATEYFLDATRSILAENDSPDVGFRYSINPYRGCEHGCVYCYARVTHEYLGFSAGVDFESKILIKREAPILLEQAFRSKSWMPQIVALSGNTDPYQPVERRLNLTRRCLEVFLEYRNPVSIITKNFLITRDLDILKEMACLELVQVFFSIPTLNTELASVMEPRASTPLRRLDAIQILAQHGIPVGVNVAPVIPGLTDEEIPSILRAAGERGARMASYIMVRLPGAVKDVFIDWLERTMPDRAGKILGRLRDIRGGRLYDSRFATRGQGEGSMAESIRDLFRISSRKYIPISAAVDLSTAHFRRQAQAQLSLQFET